MRKHLSLFLLSVLALLLLSFTSFAQAYHYQLSVQLYDFYPTVEPDPLNISIYYTVNYEYDAMNGSSWDVTGVDCEFNGYRFQTDDVRYGGTDYVWVMMQNSPLEDPFIHIFWDPANTVREMVVELWTVGQEVYYIANSDNDISDVIEEGVGWAYISGFSINAVEPPSPTVPIPTSIVLLGTGLLGLATIRKRRVKS